MRASDPYVNAFAQIFGEPPSDFAVPVDWDAVEAWLGTPLPADYKAIATAYGPLYLGDWIWLHMPFADRRWFDYGTWVQKTRRMAPGVLPIGASRGSETLFWDTTVSQNPDRWPVIIHSTHDEYGDRDPWRRFATPLIPTLAHLVEEGLQPTAVRSPIQSDLAPTAWTPPPRRPEPTPQQRAAFAAGSGLETLTALVIPPETPDLGEHAWDWLFARLGTRLPGEYVRLIEAYGAGIWVDYLRFRAPLADDRYALAPLAEWHTEAYRGLRAEFPEYHPLAVWPEPGGFLSFGDTVDGDEWGWLTIGATPDDWPLIVVPRHADQGPPLEAGLTDTLLMWLRGEFETEGLPSMGYPHEHPLDYITFEPFD